MSQSGQHAQPDGKGRHDAVSAWERSRRQLVVHPAAFVPMSDQDKQQVLDALVALLIPYLRQQGGDADERP